MSTQTRYPVATPRPRHRFTVEDYRRMIEVGILGEDARVELIGGEVVRMSAMNARHGAAIRQLDKRLQRTLGETASIGVQLPITIPPYDEPEPDVAVLRAREDEYALAKPTPADALLLIEVSDSTLAYDRDVKLGIYARAGIPESWLVDLTPRGDAIERHTEPDPATGTYRTVARFGRGEEVTSTVLPRIRLPVDAILGPHPGE